MLTVVDNLPGMTHMPFMTPLASGERVLFFCHKKTDQVWKLHYIDSSSEVRRVDTGLSDEVVECAPTAWHDADGWHISFIAGGARDNPLFRLHQLVGLSLDRLSSTVVVQPARVGFTYRERVVWGVDDDVRVHEPGEDYRIVFPQSLIYRLSYQADAPEQLIISGVKLPEKFNHASLSPVTDLKERLAQHEAGLFVVMYDLASGKQKFITCNGRPVYKCAILGDEVLYAERIGEHFEHRRLRKAKEVVFTPTNFGQRTAASTSQLAGRPSVSAGKPEPLATFHAVANAVTSAVNVLTAFVGPKASLDAIEHRSQICTECGETDAKGQRLFRLIDGAESCGQPMDPRAPDAKLLRDPVADGCGCWLKRKWASQGQACPRGKWGPEQRSGVRRNSTERRCCGS